MTPDPTPPTPAAAVLECLRDLTVDNCRSLVGWFEAGDSVIAALVSKRATAAAAATAAVKAQAHEAQLKAQGNLKK